MQTEDQLLADIKSLKIQGATDIALAVLSALEQNPSKDIGMKLAYARPTEPLAQNAVRYIFSGENVTERITQYKTYITEASSKITAEGSTLIQEGKTYLTHCHASTVTNALIAANAAGADIRVIATETRPRMQGRITTSQLLDGGIRDVTMIIDAAAASVLADPTRNISGVLVGADLLSEHGFANKIGTLGIVMAAHAHNIPIYCFSTLLKYDPRPYSPHLIEMRDPKEVWPEAPENLSFYAPAFDYTPYDLGVTVISEEGLIQGHKIKETAERLYPFIRE